MRISLLILTIVIFVGCSVDQKNAPNVSSVSTAQTQTPAPASDTSPQPVQPAAVDQRVVDDVKRIVGQVLRVDPKTIGPNVPLSKQKNAADELDVLEIILRIEEFFDVEIIDDDFGGSDVSKVKNITVNELAELVVRKQKAKSSPK